MASKRFCDFPDWSEENINWYMLNNEGIVGQIKSEKPAPAGRIFRVDFDDPDKPRNSGIEMKSCEQGQIRVAWRPGVFYGLDDDLKDILITVEDLKNRLWLYEDNLELLLYAKQLKLGDKVDVRVPIKKSSWIVQGTLKYIGPKDPKIPGKYFGIQLDRNWDDSVAINYSWCKGGKGVLVAVNNIQPPHIKKHDSKPKTRRDQKPSREYTMDKVSDVGVKAAVKPPYIKADDDVLKNLSRGEFADSKVPDSILQYVAKNLSYEWKTLARALNISDANLHNIETDHSRSMHDIKYYMLRHWSKSHGSGATYRVLATALDVADLRDLREYVESQAKITC